MHVSGVGAGVTFSFVTYPSVLVRWQARNGDSFMGKKSFAAALTGLFNKFPGRRKTMVMGRSKSYSFADSTWLTLAWAT